MKRATLVFTLLLLSFSLIGCKSTKTGSQAEVPMYDQKQDSSLGQSMADCTARITMHMMQSPAFTKAQSMPKIILGKITNTTGDDKLPIHVVENAMQNIVVKSERAIIVPHGMSEFDYTTHVAINHIKSQAEPQRQSKDYTIRVQLLNYYGELIGQWSAKTSSF